MEFPLRRLHPAPPGRAFRARFRDRIFLQPSAWQLAPPCEDCAMPEKITVKFETAVSRAVGKDPRFPAEAYFFLRDALDATIKAQQKGRSRDHTHVNGRELCEGFRDHALSQYGPIVPSLMETWGLSCTRHIGEMVFNLIDAGAFSKSDTDQVEDFVGIYDFHDAFTAPFLPDTPRP